MSTLFCPDGINHLHSFWDRVRYGRATLKDVAARIDFTVEFTHPETHEHVHATGSYPDEKGFYSITITTAKKTETTTAEYSDDHRGLYYLLPRHFLSETERARVHVKLDYASLDIAHKALYLSAVEKGSVKCTCVYTKECSFKLFDRMTFDFSQVLDEASGLVTCEFAYELNPSTKPTIPHADLGGLERSGSTETVIEAEDDPDCDLSTIAAKVAAFVEELEQETKQTKEPVKSIFDRPMSIVGVIPYPRAVTASDVLRKFNQRVTGRIPED